MKHLLFLLIFLSIGFSNTSAQTQKNSPFLFDQFKDSYVIYKDGRRFSVKINYDLIAEKFLFTEASSSTPKEFSEPNMVALIKVGERTFIPEGDKATEVIQQEPKFYVTYTSISKKAPKNTSYGGTTETASVDNYSSLSGVGITSGTPTNNRVVSETINTYEVKINSKNKSFYNKKSFLKCFPKEDREALESYVDEQKINFDSIEQVLKLYNDVITKKQ